MRPVGRRFSLLAAALLAFAVSACDTAPPEPAFVPAPSGSAVPVPTPAPAAFAGWSDPALAGKPWGDKVKGLLTFRGNPTRTFYGTGPMPRAKPAQRWKFPNQPMCKNSSDEHGVRLWCGMGWTGQPSVFERDGRTWVVFGAYDGNLHFVDGRTGARILPDFPTGDIIKGSVSVDPDGFPLLYSGSRDNYFRVIAMDRAKPVELWKLSAYDVKPVMWNNDWDSSPIIIDDYLFEGGENSQFHIVKLNRGYDANGKVTVAPKLVWHTPGWDAQLLRDAGHDTVSIENSVNVTGSTIYFANSAGLVQGWDISGLKEGRMPTRTLRFWTGDDTDASIVSDSDGMLYVGSQYEKGNKRSKEMGQMMKLDPSKPDDPVVWKIDDHNTNPGGVYSTVALHKDIVVWGTHTGYLVGVDRATGAVRWRYHVPGMGHGSPVIVDDVLVIGDCSQGYLHAFDVADTTVAPKPLWQTRPGACIESTPAVWDGTIYVGTRGGYLHALALR
ncbi:outer membrane protein assembly factor BamB family protein [Catellatospora tritici]|uniref:outer membrane protein assembly factor BamB family protein n=1 Tax=Catellatospora tritici TaxID=2851566 RepID=UPI0020C50B3A|nr:PQQ-binding-like beta-propeller repeat protein [Catellatospora tritici]